MNLAGTPPSVEMVVDSIVEAGKPRDEAEAYMDRGMRGVFEVQFGKKGYPAEWVPHLAQCAFDLMVEIGEIDLSVLDDEQREAAIAGGHSRVRH